MTLINDGVRKIDQIRELHLGGAAAGVVPSAAWQAVLRRRGR